MSKESRTNSSTLIVMFVFVILIILVNIKVPTLFTVGEFDEISVHVVKGLAEKVPDARFVMFPGSSHMTPWDARDESKISGAINFDGIPDEEAWQLVPALKMVMHMPVFGIEPTEMSVIRMAYEEQYFYVSGILNYKNPDDIRALVEFEGLKQKKPVYFAPFFHLRNWSGK